MKCFESTGRDGQRRTIEFYKSINEIVQLIDLDNKTHLDFKNGLYRIREVDIIRAADYGNVMWTDDIKTGSYTEMDAQAFFKGTNEEYLMTATDIVDHLGNDRGALILGDVDPIWGAQYMEKLLEQYKKTLELRKQIDKPLPQSLLVVDFTLALQMNRDDYLAGMQDAWEKAEEKPQVYVLTER